MKKTQLTKLSYLIDIPLILDESQLMFAEMKRHIPFPMKRFYVISNVDRNAIRGLHAHRKLQQVLFCIQGSITFVLDNGYEREEIKLDKPNVGIFIDNWMWREMKNFTPDAVLLVLASDYYKESDYIRNYDQFLFEVTTTKNKFSVRYVQHVFTMVKKAFVHQFPFITALSKKYN